MQDKSKLYFILEYCPNGDLSDFIKKNGIFIKLFIVENKFLHNITSIKY